MKWQAELDIATDAVFEAGNYLKNFDREKVINDDGRDIKHVGDINSEKIVLKRLKENSNYPVLTEETGEHGEMNASNLMWIIDPLDGTLNYSRGIKFCCISVGLFQGNKPILGTIYDFNSNELFSGIVGQGAWCNQKAIFVSGKNQPENSVLATGFPVNRDFSSKPLAVFIDKVRKYKKIRLLGSAALSLAYVGCGRVDAYMEEGIMFWDIAAGTAIVEAAGGFVSIQTSSKKKWAKIVCAGEMFRNKRECYP